MSSLTVRRSGQRRDDVGRRILGATEDLLDSGHDFVELSVGTIAEHAGVARSTFYTRFADKSALLVELSEAATDGIFTTAGRWVEAGAASGTDPADLLPALREVCARIIADYRAHAPVHAAVQAATGYDPVVAEYWNDKVDAFVRRCVVALTRVHETAGSEVPPGADVLASMAAWAIERTVSRRVPTTQPADDAVLADVLATGLWLLTFGERPGTPDAARPTPEQVPSG